MSEDGTHRYRIEFHFWPGNTEVILIEQIGDLEDGGYELNCDRFYTSARKMGVSGMPLSGQPRKMDAKFYFELLEEVEPPPVIAGEFGHLHPYWTERARKREDTNPNKDVVFHGVSEVNNGGYPWRKIDRNTSAALKQTTERAKKEGSQ